MKYFITIFCVFIWFEMFPQTKTAKEKTLSEITIQWSDSLPGDFSFAKDWSYPEEILINKEGKPRCAGVCHPRIEKMKDGSGNIPKDSLGAYYKLIDTSHYYHTMHADAWCYEYSGTNFFNCFRNEAGYINCFSVKNASTHTSLKVSITENRCIPSVHLNSIVPSTGFKIFKCTAGTMIIDRAMFSKGYLKAEFDFKFLNSVESNKPIYWKGKIAAPISDL